MKTKRFIIPWEGKFYDCKWFDETNFEKYSPIKGVHGFVFNDKDEVCLIKLSTEEVWTDLGGGIEKGDKTLEDTFIREVNEEANLEIVNLKRLAVVKFVPRNEPDKFGYDIRFVARVKKIKSQTIDPAEGEVPKRKFVSPKDFLKYTGLGKDAEFQLKIALKKLNENSSKK